MNRRTLLAAAAAVSFLPRLARSETVKPVKIGLLTDFSSGYADYTGKGSLTAATMAIEDAGKVVLGRPIEFVSVDFQLKADIGLEVAKRWYSAEGVDVIVDVPNTAVALALQDLAKTMDKVVMTNAQSSDITGKGCGPNGVQYDRSTYSVPTSLADALIERGGETWFFITVDYGLGAAYQRDATAHILARGGKVLGSVKHPLNTSDFGAYLLQAQASGAKVIAFANAGADAGNAISQAFDFGLEKTSVLAGFAVDINDIGGIGLSKLKGAFVPNAGYWDMTDATRAFNKRFMPVVGKPANSNQMGVYFMIRHYLKAVAALGSQASGREVMAKMRAIPVDDMVSKKAWLREDGRVMRDMFLAQIKSPAESTSQWDVLKIIDRVSPEVAFGTAAESACPMLRT